MNVKKKLFNFLNKVYVKQHVYVQVQKMDIEGTLL